jgi:uncharacterized LabA/DUF88 family protein
LRLKDFETKPNNNIVERLNGTFRERTKVMRSLSTDGGADAYIKGMQTYYNYIRPHQGIGGRTPSQMAHIPINLDGNRWLKMIELAVVDGSNLFKSMKRNNKNIWPPELVDILTPHIGESIKPINDIHYFTSFNKNNEKQEKALNKMEDQGVLVYPFELKEYPDRNPCSSCNNTCSECGRDLRIKPHKEKMVDIAIATKLLELGYQKEPFAYDLFIVLSGDKDLIPAIDLLREKLDKKVIVVGFRHRDKDKNTLSYELGRSANKTINLNDIL